MPLAYGVAAEEPGFALAMRGENPGTVEKPGVFLSLDRSWAREIGPDVIHSGECSNSMKQHQYNLTETISVEFSRFFGSII